MLVQPDGSGHVEASLEVWNQQYISNANSRMHTAGTGNIKLKPVRNAGTCEQLIMRVAIYSMQEPAIYLRSEQLCEQRRNLKLKLLPD